MSSVFQYTANVCEALVVRGNKLLILYLRFTNASFFMFLIPPLFCFLGAQDRLSSIKLDFPKSQQHD